MTLGRPSERGSILQKEDTIFLKRKEKDQQVADPFNTLLTSSLDTWSATSLRSWSRKISWESVTDDEDLTSTSMGRTYADHESQTADDASEGQQTLGSMIGQGTFSSLGGQQTFGSGPIRLTDVPPTTIDDGAPPAHCCSRCQAFHPLHKHAARCICSPCSSCPPPLHISCYARAPEAGHHEAGLLVSIDLLIQ